MRSTISTAFCATSTSTATTRWDTLSDTAISGCNAIDWIERARCGRQILQGCQRKIVGICPIRAVVQYYMLAHNVGWFSKLRWVTETSLLKTLAGKHKSSVAAMACKYKATTETVSGLRKCFKVVVQRGSDKKPLIAQFGGIPLKRKRDAILVDHQPQFAMANRSELLQRVLADKRELCGSKEKVEVRHVRKLADLKRPGRKEKPEWVKQMIARRRKTLVVCRKCREAIHAGTSTASFRRKGTGEPRDAKVSCVVREEDNGKGP